MRWSGLVMAAVVAVLALTAGAGAASRPKVKNTNGWIAALAMDGPLVAYDVEARGAGCNRLFVWNVRTQGGALVSGKGTCTADSTSTGAGVREIAVAGTRIAWIANLGGNTESNDYLYTATLPKPSEKRLAWARRTGDVDGILEGDWIGGLVGDGRLLAANFWTTDDEGTVTRSSLRAVPSLSAIESGPGSMTARSADLGRIAVLGPYGTVSIHSAGGLLLRTIQPSSAREIALRKDYLVVLTRAKMLEIYNANTGEPVRAWPVPGGASHLDVHAGIAVYSVWRKLHALRLTTGKDVVLVSARRAIVGAEIEAPGIVYAFNSVKRLGQVGNVGFVPMALAVDAVS